MFSKLQAVLQRAVPAGRSPLRAAAFYRTSVITRAQRAALSEHLRHAVVGAILDRERNRRSISISRDGSRYATGLDVLTDAERLLVVARVEMGYSYEQIAAVGGYRSANSARAAVVRALIRLVEVMPDE